MKLLGFGGFLLKAQNEYVVSTELVANMVGDLLGNSYFVERMGARNDGAWKRFILALKAADDGKAAGISKEAQKYLSGLYKSYVKAVDAAGSGVKVSSITDEREKEKAAERAVDERKSKTSSGDIDSRYPIDQEVRAAVHKAISSSEKRMEDFGEITREQGMAINRLANVTQNDFYRGRFTGGKHLASYDAIRHSLSEHGDFLREGLRAQLPLTPEDIARHLSAIKSGKTPTKILPTNTVRGTSSILSSYEINGYTLYAEELKKTLSKDAPSNLIGHTIYKAPTLATAATPATSAGVLPKRQIQVLRQYYTLNGGGLSTGNFIKNSENEPALLNYLVENHSPKADTYLAGLIALSSDSKNFTDKKGDVKQGYVICKQPFFITSQNKVFSRSNDDVAEKIKNLKNKGYDCFIFEKTPGDNYMVVIVNKAQIIEPKRMVKPSDSTNDKRRGEAEVQRKEVRRETVEKASSDERKSKKAYRRAEAALEEFGATSDFAQAGLENDTKNQKGREISSFCFYMGGGSSGSGAISGGASI